MFRYRTDIHPVTWTGLPKARSLTLCAVLAVMLGGCAPYQPIRVPAEPDFSTGTQAGLSPDRALSTATIQHRVVTRNPDLQAARHRLGEADAYVRMAGALPDPGLALALDHPVNGAGLINALNQSLSLDLGALVTRGDRLDAARAERLRTRLGLAWQVLTTEASALDADLALIGTRQQMVLLANDAQAVDSRLAKARTALAKGYVTQDVVAAEVVRAADIARQRATLRQQATRLRQRLNALMGVQPTARWPVATKLPAMARPAPEAIRQRLAQLAERRPDLLALRAGIQRADAEYRAAILSQFPGFNLGLSRANDTSNVQTVGITLGLNLPIFGAAQAAVARTKATRSALVAEFQARIDQAHAEVAQLRARRDNLSRQLNEIDARLPLLRQTAAHARRALNAGYFSAGAYLAVYRSLTAEQLNRIQTRQAIAQNELALVTLLGESAHFEPSDSTASSVRNPS